MNPRMELLVGDHLIAYLYWFGFVPRVGEWIRKDGQRFQITQVEHCLEQGGVTIRLHCIGAPA